MTFYVLYVKILLNDFKEVKKMAKTISGEEIYFKIEEARLKKFISKKKLAISIGMSPTNFYDTMNLLLKDNIRYNSIIKIANFLGIDLGIRI
nr:MAG TPA: Regulatory protein-modification, helix-turn-helix, transcriptional regulator, DNA [Caudoviricetes sp.]